MPTRRGGRQAPRGGAGGPGGRQRDGGLPLRPRLAWAPGSPFVMVVTAEKAGPKVVSILVWRENECDSALTPRRMWTHTWMWADTIPLRSPHARTLADTPTTHTAQPTRGTSRDGLRVPESPPGPWAAGWAQGVPRGDPPQRCPSPRRCLGWEGCSAPRRSGCSGRPCPSSCSRAASRLLGRRPLQAEHKHGAPGCGPGPAGWRGCSARGGGPALEGLAPPPIATSVGSCGPSPLPSRLCQVWTGRREGGGPGWGPGAGAQFHLAPRLSPWEKPTSSAPCPPNSCSAVPRGPRSKCPWGQGWASLRPFPARVGVVRHQFPGWQDAGHTPGDLWVASHPSPAAPHTESPFRQERSTELRLLTVCSRPPQEQSMVLLAPQGESVSRAGVSR